MRRVSVSKAQQSAELCHCGSCDFLFLQDPTWLALAYEDSFYGDTGYVDRNLHASRLLRLLFSAGKVLGIGTIERFCDVGTGLGMLPRMMRDHGYNFFGSDAYAAMELIRPFCHPPADPPFGAKTAFEVIEHVACAPEFLRRELADTPLLVFSTLMRKDGEIPEADWWYYAFGNGQHISFHSRRSFLVAMECANLDPDWLVTIDGPAHPRAIHAIAPQERWRVAFRCAGWLANRGLQALPLLVLERLAGLRPRIIEDHYLAMDLQRSGARGKTSKPGA